MYSSMSKNNPRISIVVPTHEMAHKDFFMKRLVDSLDKQSFRDFELIVTNEGKMAANTNSGIKKAKGEIVKILFMDDYLHDVDALKHIDEAFTGGWMASGCIHDNGKYLFNPHFPKWDADIRGGRNTIGSPSVIAFENDNPEFFDEQLSWLLDCDLYYRLYERYGEPTIINYTDIAIGVGNHQTTYLMSDVEKWEEHQYLKQKYATTD